MRVRAALAGLVVAVGVGTASAAGNASAEPAANRLRAFSGCPAFLEHVRARALPLVGPWGLGGSPIAIAMPGAARGGDLRAQRRERGRVLRHQRAGGGCRRAGSHEDRRSHALRRLRRQAQGRRRPCPSAAARRLAAARPGLGTRAPAPRQARPRPLAGLTRVASGRRPARDPRAVAVPVPHDAHRGRRQRSGPPADRAQHRARGRLPHGAARRSHGPDRPLLADGARPAVRLALGDER